MLNDINEIFKKTLPNGIFQRLKKNNLLGEVKNLTFFLDIHYDNVSWSQRFWHIRNNVFKIILCESCNQLARYRISKSEYYTCSDKCGIKKFSNTIRRRNDREREIIKEKRKKTCQEKYGVDHPMKSEIVKEKRKKTCQEKYGVDHSLKSEIVKEKRKKTCQEKYGVSNPMKNDVIRGKLKKTMLQNHDGLWNSQTNDFKEKIKETSLKRYGKENYSQTEDYKKKATQTNILKYGYSNPMKNVEIFEKSIKNSHLWKDYYTPSGKIIKIQGYENLALDELFSKYDEEDIITNNRKIRQCIGKIEYENGKVYYPDIYIIPENKIIEVKSIYTYKKDLETNFKKKHFCEFIGLNFEFYVYKQDKTRIIL